MTSVGRGLWIALFACVCAADARAQTVSMDIHDGVVLLIARDVPLQRILSEWSSVGGVDVIVRGDGLSPAPVTMLLRDVTEREAAEILLRDVGGYLLVGRAAGTNGKSAYGRIIVVPGKGPLPLNAAADRQLPGSRPAPGAAAAFSEGVTATVPRTEAALPPDIEEPAEPDEPAARAESDPIPPTPLSPDPPPATTAANPFGAAGSNRPGTIVGPPQAPPGVVYPPVTNPDAQRGFNPGTPPPGR